MKKVAFHTLGCKLNFSETSSIARSCQNEGYEKVDFKEKADIYVLNTCSVTENADKECKRLISQVLKINSGINTVSLVKAVEKISEVSYFYQPNLSQINLDLIINF